MEYPVLKYLKNFISGKANEQNKIPFNYPTPISQKLDMKIVAVEKGEAKIRLLTDIKIHGNQQGTVHGGLLCELADAAIGTAHSTLMQDSESFTTIEIKVNFLRPVWDNELIAHAYPKHNGKTITVYSCEIINKEKKVVAIATSTIMTLSGIKAKGR